MLLTVQHQTRYTYSQPVRGVVQSHRLTPSKFDGQRCINWQVSVSDGIMGGSFRDGAGDLVQGWSVQGPVSEIVVMVQGQVETSDTSGVLRGHRETVSPLCYLQWTMQTRADVALGKLAEASGKADGSLNSAHSLSAAVSEAIVYKPGSTTAATTAAEALALGEGVCQDHAHALIAAARHLAMPARYVTGYLHATEDDAPHEASHAWVEIWVDGLGWIGFDPANACCPDERYIRTGSGLDARDAAPIRGTARGAGDEDLDVAVAVQLNDQ